MHNDSVESVIRIVALSRGHRILHILSRKQIRFLVLRCDQIFEKRKCVIRKMSEILVIWISHSNYAQILRHVGEMSEKTIDGR